MSLGLTEGRVSPRAAAAAVIGTAPENEGEDPFAHCRPLVREGAERWKSYRCVYITGRKEDRLPQVAAQMDAILADDPDDGAALTIRATCAAYLGEPDMIERAHRAIAALEAEGDLVNAAYAYLQLSSLQVVHDPAAAEQSLERAMAMAERSGDEALLAFARLDHARFLHTEGGDLDEVTQVLADLRPMFEKSKIYGFKTGYLELQENLWNDLGQHERTLEVQLELLALHRRVGDDHGLAQTLGHIVVQLWSDPSRARSLFGVSLPQLAIWALRLARSSGNPRAEHKAELLLAQLRMGQEERRFDRCLALAEQVENLYKQSRCLTARALFRLGHDPDRAFEDIERSAQLAAGMSQEPQWVDIVRLAMLWTAGRDQALAASLSHLDDLEDTVRRQRSTLTRAMVRSYYLAHYYYVADRVLDQAPAGPTREHVDTALRIVERMRAQELLHALETRPTSASPDDPRRRAHVAANEEISQIQRSLLEHALGSAERESLLRRLARAEKEERAAWDEVLRADPVVANVERTTPPALDELQQALRDDEALLSYQLGATIELPQPRPVHTTPRVVVITRRSVRVLDLPPGPDLAPLVDLFGGLFEARQGRERKPAAGLHARLLAEALDGLPPTIEHLVLVPDGPLHRLPFAALRAEASAPPLVERYRLSQVPSLALWLRLRRSAPPRGRGALVLADPQLAGPARGVADDRASALQDSLNLGQLPHAREEGEALVRHVGQGSELRVGESATEAGLKAGDVAHFSILHFASHAVLDDEHPERSAVVLAPGSEAEDGLLQTREIARLDLHGALVVLASCRSGSGPVVGGEGPVGLSRAFFEAGARTVVASLWRLRDDEAAALFDAFYRHLRRGLSVSAALRAAQGERRRAGAPAAAWAGLMVLGDGEFVPFPHTVDPATVGWWALGGVLLVAFLLGGLAGLGSWRRRRVSDQGGARPHPERPPSW